MQKSRLFGALCGVLFAFVTVSADAALVSRLGGQAVYDTDRDITWLANANLAASNTFGLGTGVSLGTHPADSSGFDGFIDPAGDMNWPAALFWIDAMNAANYLGFNDWRLPTTTQPDATCSLQAGGDPPPDYGLGCTGSEMGHLFYDELGATANTSVLETGDPEELAKFSNTILPLVYWSSTEVSNSIAYILDFRNGNQFFLNKDREVFVFAVRDGDVGSTGIVDYSITGTVSTASAGNPFGLDVGDTISVCGVMEELQGAGLETRLFGAVNTMTITAGNVELAALNAINPPKVEFLDGELWSISYNAQIGFPEGSPSPVNFFIDTTQITRLTSFSGSDEDFKSIIGSIDDFTMSACSTIPPPAAPRPMSWLPLLLEE